MKRGNVDLRTCCKGDILISALGSKLRYIQESSGNYDHLVEYLEEGRGQGTRTHDGYVFEMNRKPEIDHDIVKIIPLRQIKLERILKNEQRKNIIKLA